MMRRSNRQRRAGFTIVELMVALTIGLMVISAAYYISRTTGRMFSEQLRRAETQLTLRSAVELLRRDVSRAGFGSVRGTTEMPGCTNAAGAGNWIGAVGPATINISPVPVFAAWVVAGATPGSQLLYLSGNMSTSEIYAIDSVQSTPNSLVLQTVAPPFTRSFINGNDGVTFLPDRFLDAFLTTRNATPPGRLVHVQDLISRRGFLRLVTAVSHNNGVAPSIQITPALPSGLPGEGGCSWGAGQSMVSPVTVIRYEVVNTATDADAAAAVAAVGTAQASDVGWMSGGPRSVLVRREIDASTLGAPTPTFIAGTTRAVVDFVDPVEGFRVQAIQDSAAQNVGAMPIPLRTADPTVINAATIRSLVITIIARSAEQQLGSALEQQRVQSGRRFARFEVFMPNAARNPGLRP